MGAQGDGVGEAETFAGTREVMVALTLPGELVAARVAGDRGEVADILQASADRVVPPCPHFGPCGGCTFQHWAREPYLEWKLERVRHVLRRAHLEAPVELAYAAPPGARRRLALHARRIGRSARVGFKGRRSWDLAPIETCVIARPALVAALPALARLAEPFLASPKSAPTLHVTETDTGLDIDITGVERPGPSADALALAAQVASEAGFARVTMMGDPVCQVRRPVVKLGPAQVSLPAGGFLQATAGAEAAMASILVEAAKGARTVADLYCGAGAFAFRLAAGAQVIAADASAPAISALNAAIATAPGLKSIDAQTRDLERRPVLATELARVDFAVFDPPRAGAAVQAVELARSKVPRVAAVSCNPATFARDARTLADGGYRLDHVHVVDQFLWSSHIELVALFTREAA
ncbi:MAG: class I SAM-dependent RNA methyltransferase [Caulobacteraceae bacterium]|nr:class I SAM-dependent RNA methyltransferase [Caulobacteraceae bacterium]